MYLEFIHCFRMELVDLSYLILIITKKVHRRQTLLIRIMNGRMR